MISRPEYINKLLSFKDKQLIKIITGVRRCGKSTLFKLYQEELIRLGVTSNQIQDINFENPNYEKFLDWRKLYEYISDNLIADKKNYIFLDEIQNVTDFQKAADGLFIKKNVDLYLTGSNSKMKSGEWATLLSGRYVEIHMFPLSFKEFLSKFNNDKGDIPLKFRTYLEYSSFPQILEEFYQPNMPTAVQFDKTAVHNYLSGIYNTIVLKDIIEVKKIKDASRLESVVCFMADSIGSETSINNIAMTMTKDGRKIDNYEVEKYLDALRESYIFYRADRYDVKGKKLLKTLNKYYLVDIGLRYFLLGDKKADRGHILENIVYLELLRRGYKVYIGEVKVIENCGEKRTIKYKQVDFAAEGLNGVEYYQVSDSVRDEATLTRELVPLDAIRDHNPKFLLTTDYDPRISHNGIKQLNVYDWLLS